MAIGSDIPEGLTLVRDATSYQDKERASFKDAAESLRNVEKVLQKDTVFKDELLELKKTFEASARKYAQEQNVIAAEISKMREGGATEQEILAYIKKNSGIYRESSQKMQSSFKLFHDSLNTMTEDSKALSYEERLLLKRQLSTMEKNYELQLTYEDKRQQIFDEMNESLAQLRKSDEEKNVKEKRQGHSTLKNTLLTTFLGPLRLLTDPLLKVVNQISHNEEGQDTFATLQALSKNKEQEFDIRDAAQKKLNELELERSKSDYVEQLMRHSDAGQLETNRAELLPPAETPLAIPAPAPTQLVLTSSAIEDTVLETNRAELLPPAETDGLIMGLPDQQEIPLGIEGTPEEEALESSLMDRISPDQASLLAKGGVVGAGVVFLARKFGLITDVFDDAKKKDKDEEGGLGKATIDFIKKNGLGMLKVAAPLAVMALGGVAITKGLQMQRRDSDDAHQYFDEGNTARGVETIILGDRARLTEENANQELGWTAGKTALMAGGAGLVAAGGVGTAAMVGTVASAGGIAAAGGLGAVGTAGLAAMGAVLPPALIAAAVITAGMIVAKGTQEAFELGWDKNQAVIQKELNDTMLSEDSSTLDKIKAGAASVWKGFTGGLAGGIREVGKVLDAETAIQNEKQVNFIKEQAEAGNEGYQRLMEMMQSEQFQVLSETEQKTMMQAEGLYDEFKASQEATRKNLGDHLLTAGKTIGGFFTRLVDTTMEGMRGRETAVWEQAALKGMEDMTGEDRDRLVNSQAYQEAASSGKDHKGAMEAAYLSEAREKAVARGDLREDGMAIQEGNWLAGMMAGGATGLAGGSIPGAIVGGLGGAIGGSVFGKYLGLGDTGLAYQERKSDEEYRQTFEYTKRKTDLMQQGMSAEEADLAAIEEQNTLYEQAMTLRIKQSKDYKKEFDKQLKEGKSIKKAEEAALRVARENTRNTMTTTKLVKAKFTEMGETLKEWAGNIGNFFKEKFSAAGDGMTNMGNMIKEGAQGVWNAVSEWFSGIWRGIGDKVKDALGAVADGWDWVKGKAGDVENWFTELFFGGRDSSSDPARINDGIVTKDGRVIELSPDDNVYATKNDLASARDSEAQAAMPDVPRTPSEFTDAGIIAAIQVLTNVLKNKDMSTTVLSPGEITNFDQFRMADALD
jgi:hypothetical protein